MSINIYQAYDLSLDFMRIGEPMEAAIYHACQREIKYEHDAQVMILHWHHHRLPSFDGKGYPRIEK